jgi:hypothetical protein
MPAPVSIASIQSLPPGPFDNTGTAGIRITNGVTTYFKITGANLNRIVSVNWYPQNPATVLQKSRNMILIDNTQGTFAITVLENYLSCKDRGGYISFGLDDGTTMVAPVKTYGRLSMMPIWQAPDSGLITG